MDEGDVAYWHERLDPDGEVLRPGDVVGLHADGKVGLNTRDAQLVSVVPREGQGGPIVAARAPPQAQRWKYCMVAYLGQVNVRLAAGEHEFLRFLEGGGGGGSSGDGSGSSTDREGGTAMRASTGGGGGGGALLIASGRGDGCACVFKRTAPSMWALAAPRWHEVIGTTMGRPFWVERPEGNGGDYFVRAIVFRNGGGPLLQT